MVEFVIYDVMCLFGFGIAYVYITYGSLTFRCMKITMFCIFHRVNRQQNQLFSQRLI